MGTSWGRWGTWGDDVGRGSLSGGPLDRRNSHMIVGGKPQDYKSYQLSRTEPDPGLR